MKWYTTLVLFSIAMIANGQPPADVKPSTGKKELALQWEFCQADLQQWYPATIPGCVHTDLITNGVIAHPFYGTNEKDCQWVGEKDWTYRSKPFDVDASLLNNALVHLHFGGLDTYADVYVNDKLVLTTDNAFRSWEIDGKKDLHETGNVITIKFHSPLPIGEAKLKALPYPLPGDGIRAVTRKPQFHYGWDWGPKLITCGITKPISLLFCEKARFTDIRIEQIKVSEERAELKTTFMVHSLTEEDCKITFEMLKNGDNWTSEVHLKKGNNIIELPFQIDFPYMWWCNDQGKQNLYEFEAVMRTETEVIDTRRVRTGLRNVQLVTEKDSIGESFYFKLNGQPVFIKGANYIPIKYFPGEAKTEDYRKLLENCRDAHINMLRVWGGGVYEDEIFYKLCDEMGIMVWQDFMFACSMYPADSAFVTTLIEEANEQTIRLRNHPCIALWCGNNENAEGWDRWGWQTGLNEKTKAQIWRAYKDVFDLTLGKIVKKNTHTNYWESSPRYGRADARSFTEGDSHYWGLWHDEEPFEDLQKKIPRFMSEFGMQSFPSEEVLREMTTMDELRYNDPGLLQHQKHNRGFALMDKYMENWYPKIPHSDLLRYAYMTQAVQAEGMGMGIEAQRRAMPRCMGTMYWQLNDVWPSFSWSGIDYKGNTKLLHDYLRTVYAPQLISCVVENDELKIYWISDNGMEDEDMVLQFSIYEGNNMDLMSMDKRTAPIYTSPVVSVTLQEGSHIIFSGALKGIMGNVSPENYLISVVCRRPGETPETYSREQKLIAKSSMEIAPRIITVQDKDPKTGQRKDWNIIYFDAPEKK